MILKFQIPNPARGAAERSEAKFQIVNRKSQIFLYIYKKKSN